MHARSRVPLMFASFLSTSHRSSRTNRRHLAQPSPSIIIMVSRGSERRTCEFCGTAYAKKEHYERHVRTHTGERPFKCQYCHSHFPRRDTLRRHTRSCRGITDNRGDVPLYGVRTTSENQSLGQSPQPSVVHDATTDASAAIIRDQPIECGDLDCTSSSVDLGGTLPPHLVFSSPTADFDWQWDTALDLDPSFTFGNLSNFGLDAVGGDATSLLQSTSVDRPEAAKSNPPIEHGQPKRLHWFTELPSHPASPAPVLDFQTQDSTLAHSEISRDLLASSLQQPIPFTALPSTSFLNRCIHSYTTRLWPVLPIVHLPSFQPACSHPLLLLSICSLGALAEGSQEALYHAERLHEGVRKAILAGFSPSSVVDDHTFPLLQAATIGQTYALLSGQAKHFLTAQSFHAALCVALRRYRDHMFGSEAMLLSRVQTQSRVEDWAGWVQAQTMIRLLNTLHIHDGEVSATMQQPAFMRLHPLKTAIAAPDNQFLAKTAEDWISLSCHEAPQQASRWPTFSSYAVLECFIGEISHCRSALFRRMDEQHVRDFQELLRKWFTQSKPSFPADRPQRLALLILWHSCFLVLFCDIDVLEKACGRDRSSMSTEETEELDAWHCTSHAQQAVLHAMSICKLGEHFRVSDIPAVHVARSIWHSGLVLAVYSSLALDGRSGDLSGIDDCDPELGMLQELDSFADRDQVIEKNNTTPTRCRTVAFTASISLRHLGPWPVTNCYASILDQILS